SAHRKCRREFRRRGIRAPVYRRADCPRLLSDFLELARQRDSASVSRALQNSRDMGYRYSRARQAHPPSRSITRCGFNGRHVLRRTDRRSARAAIDGGTRTREPGDLREAVSLGARLDSARGVKNAHEKRYKVVAYDFGIKQNILRILVDHNCAVTVVPASTLAEDVLA